MSLFVGFSSLKKREVRYGGTWERSLFLLIYLVIYLMEIGGKYLRLGVGESLHVEVYFVSF